MTQLYSGPAGVVDSYDSYDGLGLAQLVRRRQVSAAELLEEAIGRMEAVNPVLGAVAERAYDRARAHAAAPVAAGLFAGVPLVMKDIGAAVAGLRQTAGSRLAGDHVPPRDGEFTARLKAQGFNIFAVSTCPEFGVAYTTESQRYGVTRNPWNSGLSTGGSSGGAAALVAAGVVPLAHANDGGGSIRIPASCNGLFGLKPTRGRTPVGPDVGENWSGLGIELAITRSVRDTAALLETLSGPELGAPYAAPSGEAWQAAIARPPRRLRIAVARRFGDHGIDAEVATALDDAARLLEGLGHTIVEADPPLDTERMQWALYAIIAANTRAVVDFITGLRGRPLDDDELEPWTHLILGHAATLGGHDYANALTAIHQIGRNFAEFLTGYDVLLTPTLAKRPQPIGALYTPDRSIGFDAVCRRNFEFSPFTTLYNVSGHPAASVPLYWSADDVPIGIQIGGRFGDETTLLQLAAELELARPWFDRRPGTHQRHTVAY